MSEKMFLFFTFLSVITLIYVYILLHVFCCRPDDLELSDSLHNPMLSSDKFRAALKTHLFSKYQKM